MNDHDLADLCRLSYDDVPGELSLGGSLGTKAYIVRRQGKPLVVVFRGTDDVTDWLYNLNAQKAKHHWGCVHQGFLGAWFAIKRQVLAEVEGGEVLFAGHSLGGALATLAAADVPGQTRAVVTFGSPRVGDAEFVDEYAKTLAGVTRRYHYRFDPVPMVPAYMMGFRHVVNPRWHDGNALRDGISWAGAARMAGGTVSKWVRQAFTAESFKAHLRELVGDHGMDKYVDVVK